MKKSIIFVGSVQKEFREERTAIRDFVRGDALLRRFFDVFLFEDIPASDRKPDDVYLDEVDRCRVYVGLFGNEYGTPVANGKSATELEFDRATAKKKTRLVFVKGSDDTDRHPRMLALIRKIGSQLVRRRFSGIPDLTAALYAALVEHLEQTGHLRTLPFDASACDGATMDDLSDEKLRWFLGTARRERNYALPGKTPREKALRHLNLIDRGHPTHAAVLLFGEEPQRFLIASEVKCLHFHGTEVRKPIPSYQVFKGTVFDLVDQAVDFVLSKVARSVGTREHSVQAPVEYELPKEAVREAIVNAVAHRDYASNASVQVMLFADRLEVWNPGELPPSLTPELLRGPHASIPRNPLIAEPLFLARYIEKAGTGTLDMIARCREAGLPEPDFEQRAGQWVVTLWRDWLTEQAMSRMDLSDKQKQGIAFVKANGRITNRDYRELTGAIIRTASRDFEDLVSKGILGKVGTTGRSAHYVLALKQDTNRTNRT
ncbi:MAG: ATP-binding protein [Deltaproteobacteria bacterium]|nr:ATP-binding protein [Deltaproteobacteria bacterium]